MPLLRDAVENVRSIFIKRLIQAGAFKQSDQVLQKLTLTELIHEYKSFQNECKK
jgi:hypothetical protein